MQLDIPFHFQKAQHKMMDAGESCVSNTILVFFWMDKLLSKVRIKREALKIKIKVKV